MLPLDQAIQHLVQDFDLSTDLNKILVDTIENAVLTEWVLNQVWVVGHLPHVHHPVLQAEVEVVGPRVGIHLSVVGRNHSRITDFLVFLNLSDLEITPSISSINVL